MKRKVLFRQWAVFENVRAYEEVHPSRLNSTFNDYSAIRNKGQYIIAPTLYVYPNTVIHGSLLVRKKIV